MAAGAYRGAGVLPAIVVTDKVDTGAGRMLSDRGDCFDACGAGGTGSGTGEQGAVPEHGRVYRDGTCSDQPYKYGIRVKLHWADASEYVEVSP